MSQVKATPITIQQVKDSDSINITGTEFVTPKKATVLSYNSGTLIQDENNKLFLVSVGNWFRSSYNGSALPQIDCFNELQDLGLTVIKDQLFRKKEEKVEKLNGQEVRGKDNVGVKKIDKTVASNTKSEKKD